MTEKEWNAADLLTTTANFLGEKGLSSPRLEAELLLSAVLGLTRVQLYVNYERILSPAELEAYRVLIRRRIAHEPAAYILGRKEFYLLNLKVTPQTLIPRPETELLVDEALSLVKGLADPLIVDIGCGSGAIALALAKNLPQAQIVATDISAEALAVAQENARNLGLERVEFLLGDLTEPLNGRAFSLVCANLPYVPTGDFPSLDPGVTRFEPRLALDGGPDGLAVYQRLLSQVKNVLKPQGYLLMEIHPPTLEALEQIIRASGLNFIRPIADFNRTNRLVLAQRPE
ncbi:MAG: peptide chain release factor N(5)-glutamine methyltransferase [Deltaproteobacteria bacterium]|jgi:release factor glutamine methyltransferase|nr:peptide chain release factor N(5)-glutamine methyltransferase [Deltaproteobacteria bacterium]